MRDHSRKIKLPRRFTDLLLAQYKYQKVNGAWDLTIPEVAKEIGVKPAELEEVHMAMNMTFTEVKESHAVSELDDYENQRRLIAISDLDPKSMKILQMYYINKMTYREIGSELNANGSTIKRIITDAIAAIS